MGRKMLWTPSDDRRVAQRLRDLLGEGHQIESAIRALHQVDKIGALFLCPAVEQITGLPSAEAKRLVVRALSPLWHV
jgi:hypothetical protein